MLWVFGLKLKNHGETPTLGRFTVVLKGYLTAWSVVFPNAGEGTGLSTSPSTIERLFKTRTTEPTYVKLKQTENGEPFESLPHAKHASARAGKQSFTTDTYNISRTLGREVSACSGDILPACGRYQGACHESSRSQRSHKRDGL